MLMLGSALSILDNEEETFTDDLEEDEAFSDKTRLRLSGRKVASLTKSLNCYLG